MVSVIVASYNKAAFIGETIVSVTNQSYAGWELLIIDDASTDGSVEVIRPFLSDSRIRLVRNGENKGGNFCRNHGLQLAQGRYLVFLDADDLLSPDCLQRRVEAALKHPLANLLVFSMGVFYSKPGDAGSGWMPLSKQPLEDFLQHNLPWSILQPLWKREFILELKGFDESFQRLQDVELNTRALLSAKVNYRLLPGEPDCYYRIDESRKNFNFFSFLNRWVDSAIRYCDKLSGMVPVSLRRYLRGTIYQTYFQVLYHFKRKEISASEFGILEKKLLAHPLVTEAGGIKKQFFGISKLYNLYFFRIPGFNRVLKHLLVS